MAGPPDDKTLRAAKRRARRDLLHSCSSFQSSSGSAIAEAPSQTAPSNMSYVRSRRPSMMATTTAAILLCVLQVVGGENAMMIRSHEGLSAVGAARGWRTARFLASDRASKIDVSSLICQLGDPTRVGPSSSSNRPEVKPFVIPFYYAVATKGNATSAMDYVEQFHLQQLIFESVSDDIPWCYSLSSNQLRGSGAKRRQAIASPLELDIRSPAVVDGARQSHDEPSTGREPRQLRQIHPQSDEGRRLSILSVASGPTQPDVGTSKCSREAIGG
jgi:hypothetical protein